MYAGVETEINKKALVDVAGRFERYSDFGTTLNFKVAGRYNATDKIGARATVSTGFRAPSLHQVYFNSVSTQFVGEPLEPRQVLTANNPSGLAQEYGIPPLQQETSLNISAGLTARPVKNLSLTTDFYRTGINDRVVLSSRFPVDNPNFPSVSLAQFFMNAVDTTTMGVDVVATYNMKLSGGAKLDLSASANFTKTSVDEIHIPEQLRAIYPGRSDALLQNDIFNREEANRYEDALPRQRATASVRYKEGNVTLLGRARYFGDVWYRPNIVPDESPENIMIAQQCADDFNELPCLDENFAGKVIFDADVGVQRGKWRFSVGANNLFNTFPDRQSKDSNVSNGRFVYSRRVSQFGINGGFYYLRMQFIN